MNRVAVNAEDVPLPAWNKPLKTFALKVLGRLGMENWDLSVLLCGDKTIAALNSAYRGKTGPTDVLSFSLQEGCPPRGAGPTGAVQFSAGFSGGNRFLPGDIVISLDTLRENARLYQIGEDEELRRLLIHGILHLSGMDHRSNKKDEPMIRLQEEILTELAGRILPPHETSGGGGR
jgi:probable rRNA maturation factor